MLKNVKDAEKMDIIVWPSACCADKKWLWTMHGKINALFKHNLENGEMELSLILKQEDFFKESSMASVLVCDDKVYLIPRWGNHLHCINMNTREDDLIGIPNEIEFTNSMKFSSAFEYEKFIYCIPETYHYLLKLDPFDNTVKVLFDVNEIINKIGLERVNLGKAVLGSGGRVYSCILNTNLILCFDLKSLTYEVISIGERYNYDSIVVADDILFVSSNEESLIFVYDYKNRKIIETWNTPFDNFALSKLDGNGLLVDSIIDGRAAVLKNNKTIIYDLGHRAYQGSYGYAYHHGIVCKSNNKQLYFNRHSYCVSEIDEEDNILRDSKRLVGTVFVNLLDYELEPLMIEKELFDLKWMISKLTVL